MNWKNINKERPKGYGYDVIVFCKGGSIMIERIYNNGKGGNCFSKGWNKGEYNEVTHWMELPNRPKGV